MWWGSSRRTPGPGGDERRRLELLTRTASHSVPTKVRFPLNGNRRLVLPTPPGGEPRRDDQDQRVSTPELDALYGGSSPSCSCPWTPATPRSATSTRPRGQTSCQPCAQRSTASSRHPVLPRATRSGRRRSRSRRHRAVTVGEHAWTVGTATSFVVPSPSSRLVHQHRVHVGKAGA